MSIDDIRDSLLYIERDLIEIAEEMECSGCESSCHCVDKIKSQVGAIQKVRKDTRNIKERLFHIYGRVF